MHMSPRIVPISESEGFVAPSILRPSDTTPAPSHTIATTGADAMNCTNEGKNFFFFRSP
jgi:hypothetical protein